MVIYFKDYHYAYVTIDNNINNITTCLFLGILATYICIKKASSNDFTFCIVFVVSFICFYAKYYANCFCIK
jgi:hypothetical protein